MSSQQLDPLDLKDMPGFETQEIENKFSLRASVTGALFFTDVRIPAANVLPGVSTLKGPLSCLTQARYGISWGVIGAALDIARDARDILGGAGISAEYVPIRHMLNLESVITYEGTESIHQLVVGKELTGVNAF